MRGTPFEEKSEHLTKWKIATQKPARIVGLQRTIGREVSGGPHVVGRSESQLARKLCRRKVQKRWHPGAASYSGISYRVGGTGKQECLRYVYPSVVSATEKYLVMMFTKSHDM